MSAFVNWSPPPTLAIMQLNTHMDTQRHSVNDGLVKLQALISRSPTLSSVLILMFTAEDCAVGTVDDS